MTIRAAFSWVLASWMGLAGLAAEANADVLIKAEKHPTGEFLSTNWTFYNDTTLVWSINGYSDSMFFGAGTQVALPYNASYKFANSAIISYDQRKLYEVPAGTVLKTPDYVPTRPETRPPEEPADHRFGNVGTGVGTHSYPRSAQFLMVARLQHSIGHRHSHGLPDPHCSRV